MLGDPVWSMSASGLCGAYLKCNCFKRDAGLGTRLLEQGHLVLRGVEACPGRMEDVSVPIDL